MTDPAVPVPDDKDWTWTLASRCPECGFDAPAVDRAEVPELTRRYADVMRAAVLRAGSAVRPAPAVWSALEYGAHVADVCVLFDRRLHLMLTDDDPVFANWDQDETALEQRYWTYEPAAVAQRLTDDAARVARSFAAVDGAQWERPGRRSNGSVFTVDTFARYFLHDLAHHAWDVTER
jgi:hypothetical protein